MHLLHWLVNEQAPQYYLISPIYVNIRNKSTMCICVCMCMCEQSNANGSSTIALQQQPRPIQNGLPAFDAKTPTHSRTMSSKNLYWGFQTPR